MPNFSCKCAQKTGHSSAENPRGKIPFRPGLKSGFEKRQYFKRFRRAFQKKGGWDQAKIFGTMLALVLGGFGKHRQLGKSNESGRENRKWADGAGDLASVFAVGFRYFYANLSSLYMIDIYDTHFSQGSAY
ncbi:MAG: hypothetical protein K9K88_10500 [Desulfobacterales bacterium]|nr:hypothetical protein [Desulfobacterales bacterium]